MQTPPTPWTMRLADNSRHAHFYDADHKLIGEFALNTYVNARGWAELILAAINGRPALTIAREVEAMSAHASDELNKHLRETLEACRRYALRIADHAAGHPMDRQNAQAIVELAQTGRS